MPEMLKMIEVLSAENMKELGAMIGERLVGGECLELIGDVGAGKTTFTKGLALGLDIDEDIQSPSFTISRVYEARDNLRLDHYDFYRLPDPDILEYEFAESLADDQVITVVEWGESVENILPDNRIVVQITATADEVREVTFKGPQLEVLLKDIV